MDGVTPGRKGQDKVRDSLLDRTFTRNW